MYLYALTIILMIFASFISLDIVLAILFDVSIERKDEDYKTA
ncbi:hypothetical protein [Paraclostridium dentum]